MTTVGVIFPPELPPERLRSVAVAADQAGLPELWIWEDCFKESGIATAVAALAWTERLVVGIGVLPVPLRNVALTAMELATVSRLFPGRLVAGIGHGVLDWMEQVGARVSSPMTLLAEYAAALRALLHGETVTTDGTYVQLTDVALDWPPAIPPPMVVGAVRERTTRLAGELSDGVVFSGHTSLEDLRDAVPRFAAAAAQRPRETPAQVVAFVSVDGRASPQRLAAVVSDYAAAGATTVALLNTRDDLPLEDFVRVAARL